LSNKKKKVSEKDKKDWEDFLKNQSQVFDKDKEVLIKEDSSRFKFDLHGYSIEDANKKVVQIIENSYEKGFSEILLITGQGHHSNVDDNVYVSKDYSTLRGTIPDFIRNNLDLASKIIQIKEADEKMGGKGALIIKLKKIKE
tara:strand:+ start:167 stop:592 length:426 start_codon:yes stop_codon:yes gene_type:complete